MTKIYSANDLNETFGSKIFRWISFNMSHQYTLKHKDGSKVFVDGSLGIIFDYNTLETIEIKELKPKRSKTFHRRITR